jgi:cytochrome c
MTHSPLHFIGKVTLSAGATLMVTLAPLVSAAEQAKPPTAPPAFNNACRTCHSVMEGDHRIGPSLHKIFGAKAGSRPGFNSSAALKNSGLTWDEKTLDRFIENPEAVAPNNAMKPFGGLPDAAARQTIINYLKTATG